jgi:GNAT superfamily N-acetyltransferase
MTASLCNRVLNGAKTSGGFSVPPLPAGLSTRGKPGLSGVPRPAAAAVGLDRGWITTIGGRAAGAMVLGRVAANVAKLVLFRVDPEWHHTAVASGLIRQLYWYCREKGYRTIVVEEGTMPGWALRAFEQHGFLFSRRLPGKGRQRWEYRLG